MWRSDSLLRLAIGTKTEIVGASEYKLGMDFSNDLLSGCLSLLPVKLNRNFQSA